tara:strand:- start:386 stop:616 length:231 start_codon:yes stop_codon:yes gene_type:complete
VVLEPDEFDRVLVVAPLDVVSAKTALDIINTVKIVSKYFICFLWSVYKVFIKERASNHGRPACELGHKPVSELGRD